RAGSLAPPKAISDAVIAERIAAWLDDKKPFLIPIHGLGWAINTSDLKIADDLYLVALSDQAKSEGWYDLWSDYVSTNPRDIADCAFAIRGLTEDARHRAIDFLDALRLLRIGRISAPDCFWLGHQFSVSSGGLGPVENYGPVHRVMGPQADLAAADADRAIKLCSKLQTLRVRRAYGRA